MTFRSHILHIVNHKAMSGEWLCEEFETGFIKPEYIYDIDRMAVIKELRSKSDKLSVEFRMKWPEDAEFTWVLFSGKILYDTDGKRWKMVGSIQNIQEQKEREAKQLRKIQQMVLLDFMYSVQVWSICRCAGGLNRVV